MTTIKIMQASLSAVLLLALTGASPALDSAASSAKPYDRAVARQKFHRPAVTPFPKENAFTAERAAVGKALFFDPRLSGGNSIAAHPAITPVFRGAMACPRRSAMWQSLAEVVVGFPSKAISKALKL